MWLAALLLPVPATALLAGALVAGRRWPAVRWWHWAVALAGPALAAAAGLGLLVRLWGEPGGTVRLVVSPWSAAVFESGLALSADALAAAHLVLIAALAMGAALRGRASGDLTALAGPLLVSSGASLFVTAASEPLSFVFGWLALDLALLVGGGGGSALWLASAAGLGMGLAGIVHLPYTGTAAPTMADSAALSRLWLLGAAAVRMGLYPLWWSLPSSTERPWRALGTRLAPTVAGAYLVVLVAEPTRRLVGLGDNTLVPALLATTGGGLLAWLATGRGESLDRQAAFHAGLVALAVLVGGPIGRAVALVLTVDLLLGRAVLYAAEGVADHAVARLSRWAAAASLAGLPPTLGFAGRWLLYRELLANHAYGALIAAALASAAANMALVELVRVRAPTGRRDRLAAATLAVPAVAAVALGPALPLAGPVLARLVGAVPVNPLADMWAMLRTPMTLSLGLEMLALILLPVALGLLARRSPSGVVDARRRTAHQLLSLVSPAQSAAHVVIAAGELLQHATGLLESRRAMAWTVMAVAVTGTAMLVGGTAEVVLAPGGAASAAAGITWLPYVLASLLAMLLLVGPSPGGPLAALAGAYVLAAVIVGASGAPLVVVAIKVLVGVLVTGILAISVQQSLAPAGGADRWRGFLSGEWRLGPADQPGVMVLALLVALVLGLGTTAGGLAPDMPAGSARAAGTLILAGVLVTVFARQPLRLAVAVLFALIGFELYYAQLDPGLVITGGLGAFQLLFAVVASYHVGTLGGPADRARP